MNKPAINNVNEKKNKRNNSVGRPPIQRPCLKLLDPCERLCGSNHRLVRRLLRARTKMFVKTRLPRSCHIHFRFGSKSLIVSWRLNETSQFFCASFVWLWLFLSRVSFFSFRSRFSAIGENSRLSRLTIILERCLKT